MKFHSRRSFFSLALFLSGFAALLLQVVWTKQATWIVGVTTYAVAFVFAIFMGGLAIGCEISRFAITRVSNPGRLYAIIELLLGFVALGYALLTTQFGEDIFAFSRWSLLSLLLPTTLMGMTLPLVIHDLERHHVDAKLNTSWIYGINTIGASLGAFLGAFFIIPRLGLFQTSLLAAGIVLFASSLAFWGTKKANHKNLKSFIWAVEGANLSRESSLFFVLAFWAGFSSLTMEIVWTRLLTLILGPSVYGVGLVLFVYILGLGIGSIVSQKQIFQRFYTFQRLGLFVALCLSVLWAMIVYAFLPYLFVSIVELLRPEISMLHWIEWTLSFVSLFPLAFFHGVLVPVLIHHYSRDGSHGLASSRILVWNTLGAILGSVGAGTVFIPLLGFLGTCVLVFVGHGFFVLFLIYRESFGLVRQQRIVFASVLVLFVGIASVQARGFWDRAVLASGIYKYAVGDALGGREARIEVGKLLFYEEGRSSTVAVIETPNDRVLSIDGKADASARGDQSTQVLLSVLPLSLSENPDEVLVIGFASGVTAGVASLFPKTKVTAVDIEPAVYRASTFFQEVNFGPLSFPHELLVEDGRHFLAREPQTFDVITSEPSNPWMSGVASLFTREFFSLSKKKLRAGGVMCQWLPIYGMTKPMVATVLKTFADVFEEVLVFESVEGFDLLLIGSQEEIDLDPRRIESRWVNSTLREELKKIGVSRGADLVGRFLMGKKGISNFVDAGVPLNTDNNGYLEYQAPLALHLKTAENNHRSLIQSTEGINSYVLWSKLSKDDKERVEARLNQRGEALLKDQNKE